MRRILWAAMVGVTLGTYATVGAEEAVVGKPAPDFHLTNTHGGTNSLAAARGKYVVLEWTNYDCPFVKRHYGSGAMQKLQKRLSKFDEGRNEPEEVAARIYEALCARRPKRKYTIGQGVMLMSVLRFLPQSVVDYVFSKLV